ncbi:MAG: methylmalonyl Co-A mutase-associated GTPase MeaB, partial [Rhodoferax sp.]|nr:methylmalonyl Co-A mutase-associated GTPase MeaB [Rhodoferax sp.]
MRPFLVYLLHCVDGTYYCGHTDDIEARMQQHEVSSEGYLATRKPFSVVWQGEFETREGALGFEQRVKGWSRAKKEALIAGDWEGIKGLARGRSRTPAAFVGAEPASASVRAGLASLSVRAEPASPSVRAQPVSPTVRAEPVEASALSLSTGSGRTGEGRPALTPTLPPTVRAELVEASAPGPSTGSGRTGEETPALTPSLPPTVRAEPVEASPLIDTILHGAPQ